MIEYEYALVIKTDSYAGNFEREMCANVTGRYGDCEVGKSDAKLFHVAYPEMSKEFDSLIVARPDENGCWRPVTGTYNEAGQYNDVAMYIEEKPTSAQITFIKERSYEFAEKNKIKILGFSILTKQKILTYEDA